MILRTNRNAVHALSCQNLQPFDRFLRQLGFTFLHQKFHIEIAQEILCVLHAAQQLLTQIAAFARQQHTQTARRQFSR